MSAGKCQMVVRDSVRRSMQVNSSPLYCCAPLYTISAANHFSSTLHTTCTQHSPLVTVLRTIRCPKRLLRNFLKYSTAWSSPWSPTASAILVEYFCVQKFEICNFANEIFWEEIRLHGFWIGLHYIFGFGRKFSKKRFSSRPQQTTANAVITCKRSNFLSFNVNHVAENIKMIIYSLYLKAKTLSPTDWSRNTVSGTTERVAMQLAASS